MSEIPEVNAATFMLSTTELSELSSQFRRYSDAAMIAQTMMAGISVKLRIGGLPNGFRGVDQRLGVHLSVRFDSGYAFSFKAHDVAKAAPEEAIKLDPLCKPGTSYALYEQSTILVNWVLRDLSNGISSEIVTNINRILRNLTEKVAPDTVSEHLNVFVTCTYLMNGLREIRAGLDAYDLQGKPRQPGHDLVGVLVHRHSDSKILNAVIGTLSRS